MAPLPNLSGSLIQDTYQRVLHTDGNAIYNGIGQEVLSAAELTTLQTIGSANISSTEWLEVANIGAANISSQEWGYVASMQDVGTTSSPSFQAIYLPSSPSAEPAIRNPSGRVGFSFSDTSNTSPINVIIGSTPIAQFSGSHLSVVGNISASGDLYAELIHVGGQIRFPLDSIRVSENSSTGGLLIDGGVGVTIAPPLIANNGITTNTITASGDISSSGEIRFNNIKGGTF